MSIGVWQVILILVIVLIIFGAGKLPRVMGDVAKGVKNFKAGMKDEEETPRSLRNRSTRAIRLWRPPGRKKTRPRRPDSGVAAVGSATG